MKTNLKLNTTLTLRALEAQARRAAAIAAVTPSLPMTAPQAPSTAHESVVTTPSFKAPSRPKPHRPAKDGASRRKNADPVTRQVKQLCHAISAEVTETQLVNIETPKDGASCRAIVRVFSREDIDRQHEEEALYRQLIARGKQPAELTKPRKAAPVVMYAIYPSAFDPAKVGSVAIYADDAPMRRKLLLTRRHFFGLPIISATIEMGRRPFVDVRLK